MIMAILVTAFNVNLLYALLNLDLDAMSAFSGRKGCSTVQTPGISKKHESKIDEKKL